MFPFCRSLFRRSAVYFLAKKLFNFVNLIVGPVSWCDQKCIQKVYWGLYAEVSNLTLRSLVSLWLVCVQIRKMVKFHSAACRCSVFPELFVKDVVFSPVCIFGLFVKTQVAVGVWIYTWVLCSMISTSVSALACVLCCLYSCDLVA